MQQMYTIVYKHIRNENAFICVWFANTVFVYSEYIVLLTIRKIQAHYIKIYFCIRMYTLNSFSISE